MEVSFTQIMEVVQVVLIPLLAWIAKMLRDSSKNIKDVEQSVAVLITQQAQCEEQRGRLNKAVNKHAVTLGQHEVIILDLKNSKPLNQ